MKNLKERLIYNFKHYQMRQTQFYYNISSSLCFEQSLNSPEFFLTIIFFSLWKDISLLARDIIKDCFKFSRFYQEFQKK